MVKAITRLMVGSLSVFRGSGKRETEDCREWERTCEWSRSPATKQSIYAFKMAARTPPTPVTTLSRMPLKLFNFGKASQAVADTPSSLSPFASRVCYMNVCICVVFCVVASSNDAWEFVALFQRKFISLPPNNLYSLRYWCQQLEN